MSHDISSANEVLDALHDLAKDEDDVTIGDFVEALGGRGFGPLILIPSLLVMSPLGGIPLVPTIMSLLIALIAVQLLLQRGSLWLPSFLSNRGVKDKKVRKSVQKMRGLADWLDAHMGERLTVLISSPMPAVVAGVIILLCAVVPAVELIPFAAMVPMGAIALLGLALTVKDGAAMLVALAGSAVALIALWGWVI